MEPSTVSRPTAGGGPSEGETSLRAVLVAAYATEVVAVLVLLAFTLSGSR
jgi:hypothetical protein